MAIDPNIKEKAENIRLKKKGREVRESLAAGLEAMSEDVVSTVARQGNVEGQFQEVIDNTTGKDVISAPELIAARNGEANLKARLDKEQQQVNAQLAQTKEALTKKVLNHETRLPARDRRIIENGGEGLSPDLDYTAFFTAVNYDGREIHVGRAGNGHTGNAKLVAYVKHGDGTFFRKTIEGIDYTIGDYRDPQLYYSPQDLNGALYLVIAVLKKDGGYANYLCRLNYELNATAQWHLSDMDGYFIWGNPLVLPDQKVLFSAYKVADGIGGVTLFKSTGIEGTNIHTTKVFEVFPNTTENPTECTIGYWGDKIVAVSRQDNGNGLFRLSIDEKGEKWGDIFEFDFRGEAPKILPFTPADEPLVYTACAWNYSGSTGRSPFIKIITLKNSVPIIKNTITIDLLDNMGGYNSIVKTSNGYGFMYYEDVNSANSTNVYYKEVDLTGVLYQRSVSENFVRLQLINQWGNRYPEDHTFSYKVVEDVVNIRGQIADGSIIKGTILTTLPIHIRPKKPIMFLAQNGNSEPVGLMVSPNGEVTIQYTVGENATLFINAFYSLER